MFTRRTLFGAVAALALIGPGSGAFAQDKMLVPLISKGFQHQFWQAVKAGADKAGAELGVTVTFEGPDNETQVDKQMDMLAAALANKPAAIGFAALDSQAAIPLLRQARQSRWRRACWPEPPPACPSACRPGCRYPAPRR